MLFAVLRRLSTCPSERRNRAAAFGSTYNVLDVDHPTQCVLFAVLRRFRTCHPNHGNLATAFGFTRLPFDVDHSTQCVLCTVLRRSRTCYSERRMLTAAFSYALSRHPVWCVLCTVIRLSCAGHSKRRPLAAALTGVLCARQSTMFLPLLSNDVTLPQPPDLYFLLLEELNVPSSTCCSQHSRVILMRA